MNSYYVYIYYRLDTNEPFYVGKGKGRRWKRLDDRRNKHFIRIIDKYPIAVEIIKDNLSENEAFYWEEKIIETLVFEYGFSIDIPNNRSKEKSCHLVNQTWGGEGSSGYSHTDESKKKMSKIKGGKNNPMYGKPCSDERKRKISESLKGKYTGENNPNYGNGEKIRGENNPMYGKHHTKETKRKMSENHADVSGKNNPMYGKYHSDKTKRKIGKSVICLTTKKIFFIAKEGARHYNVDLSGIISCCKGKRNYTGRFNGKPLIWRYLIWNHNKKYRIIK